MKIYDNVGLSINNNNNNILINNINMIMDFLQEEPQPSSPSSECSGDDAGHGEVTSGRMLPKVDTDMDYHCLDELIKIFLIS